MHVLVACMVSLFAVAGFWQLYRLDERRTDNALVEQRRAMPPVTDLGTRDILHRRVELSGRYDAKSEVRLRGRGSSGRPGDHILTPLRVGERAVIVDRGWVPFDTPFERTRPPRRPVEISGLVLPSEGPGPFGGGTTRSKTTTLSRIDVARIAAQIPYSVERSVYVLLGAQQPPPSDVPQPVAPAELSEGSHLAYAVQWFTFIPIALVVYVLLLRREARKAHT